MKNYIGYLNESFGELKGWHFFRSSVVPTKDIYSYSVIAGPFRTVKAALWAVANPYGNFRDAEVNSKKGAN